MLPVLEVRALLRHGQFAVPLPETSGKGVHQLLGQVLQPSIGNDRGCTPRRWLGRPTTGPPDAPRQYDTAHLDSTHSACNSVDSGQQGPIRGGIGRGGRG